jgi:hypothetical protein
MTPYLQVFLGQWGVLEHLQAHKSHELIPPHPAKTYMNRRSKSTAARTF